MGKKRGFLLIGIILSIFLINFVSAEIEFGFDDEGSPGVVIEQPVLTISNTTSINTNSSEFWVTNLGSLNDANATQFNGDGQVLNIKPSWLSGLFYIKSIIDGFISVLNSNVQGNFTEIMNNNETWSSITNSSYMTSSDVEGSFNSTSWNRSGTNVFLANLGDRVGIGTASPDSELHVNGVIHITDPSSIRYFIEVFSAGGVGYIDSYDSTGNDYQDLVVRANDFIFEGQGTERFRIEDTGNVGIGTTTPTHTLTVVGDTNVTGDIYSNNYQVLSYQRIVDTKTVTMTVVI